MGRSPAVGMPVFIVTHEEREALPMQGGTTYTFVADGIEAALDRARAAAGDKDVGIWGGANIIRQYLQAGLLALMRSTVRSGHLCVRATPLAGRTRSGSASDRVRC
jgi:dihydrofolate reductase